MGNGRHEEVTRFVTAVMQQLALSIANGPQRVNVASTLCQPDVIVFINSVADMAKADRPVDMVAAEMLEAILSRLRAMSLARVMSRDRKQQFTVALKAILDKPDSYMDAVHTEMLDGVMELLDKLLATFGHRDPIPGQETTIQEAKCRIARRVQELYQTPRSDYDAAISRAINRVTWHTSALLCRLRLAPVLDADEDAVAAFDRFANAVVMLLDPV